MKPDYAPLIKRLKKLGGPLDGMTAAGWANDFSPWETETPEWFLFVKALGDGLDAIGAALALVEQALPMMWLSIEWAGTNKPPSEWPLIKFGTGYAEHTVQTRTAPIAIVIALLRALSQEASDAR